MKQYEENYTLRDMARDALCGNYGNVLLGQFLFGLIILGVLFLCGFPYLLSSMAALYSPSAGTDTFALRALRTGTVLAQLLNGFLHFGMSLLCLKLACSRSADWQDVFYGFRRENLLKVFMLTAVRLLWNTVCLGAGEYFSSAYLSTQDSRYLLYTLAAYGIGCCIYVPVALALDLSYFVMPDFPEKKTTALLRSCFRLIKGSRKRLFLLELSFLPLQLLSLLTLGIGSLWLRPYMYMTYTLFYLDLANPGCLSGKKCTY